MWEPVDLKLVTDRMTSRIHFNVKNKGGVMVVADIVMDVVQMSMKVNRKKNNCVLEDK